MSLHISFTGVGIAKLTFNFDVFVNIDDVPLQMIFLLEGIITIWTKKMPILIVDHLNMPK